MMPVQFVEVHLVLGLVLGLTVGLVQLVLLVAGALPCEAGDPIATQPLLLSRGKVDAALLYRVIPPGS